MSRTCTLPFLTVSTSFIPGGELEPKLIGLLPVGGISADEIVHVMPKGDELRFLKDLWFHTSNTNIEFGAAAITQRKVE